MNRIVILLSFLTLLVSIFIHPVPVFANSFCQVTNIEASNSTLTVTQLFSDTKDPNYNVVLKNNTTGSSLADSKNEKSDDIVAGTLYRTWEVSFTIPTGEDPHNYFVIANDTKGNACPWSSQDLWYTNPGTTNQNEASSIVVDPCGDVTTIGQNAYDRCQAKLACAKTQGQNGRDNGYVFLPAFNNTCTNLVEFSKTLLNYLLTFSGLIAGFMFMRGAFNILASRGDPSARAEARTTLINAGIGLVIVALAFVIIKFLNTAFSAVDSGINLLPLL